MTTFSKRHYEVIAELLGSCKTIDEAVEVACKWFKVDNDAFSKEKFLRAVENTRERLKL